MIIGTLGDIVFEVSDGVIRTLQKMERSGSARISTHQLHGGRAVTEFTGTDPENVALTFRLADYLGVHPTDDMARIRRHVYKGTALRLVLGRMKYGERWLIKSYKFTTEHTDADGNPTDVSVSLTLTAYDGGAV